MRVAILGRTEILLDAARRLREAGHDIGLVGTCRSENFYTADESDFEAFARESNTDFFNTPSINSTKILKRLRAAECEIALSMNWLTVLGEEALAAFPSGVVNAHAGDLPRFRGNACPNWAILMGEERAGLCLHLMEPGALDSGPVLLRDHFALGPEVYIGDFYDWMGARVPEMAAALIASLESGILQPEPQTGDPALSLRCYPRRPEDGRIDWRQPADQIHRLVRASSHPLTAP